MADSLVIDPPVQDGSRLFPQTLVWKRIETHHFPLLKVQVSYKHKLPQQYPDMHPSDDAWPDPDEEWISKSQLKRESHALQALGEKLVQLRKDQVAHIPLDESLRDAIELAQKIRKKHEAYRRQLQYIGKLMRSSDPEPIELALQQLMQPQREATAELHQLEAWRERLLSEGDPAITALLEAYPDGDRQHLRQLVRQAKKEQAQSKPPKAARELFKYLRELKQA